MVRKKKKRLIVDLQKQVEEVKKENDRFTRIQHDHKFPKEQRRPHTWGGRQQRKRKEETPARENTHWSRDHAAGRKSFEQTEEEECFQRFKRFEEFECREREDSQKRSRRRLEY